MKKIITSTLIWLFAIITVAYPILVAGDNFTWSLDGIFPILGILAFMLLWLHSLCGVFEEWLREYIPFDRFVSITALVILFCLIFHPLLLLISMNFHFENITLAYGVKGIWLGIIGWILLISYDVTKPFLRYQNIAKHWNKILLISNIGFLIIFPHALMIGSDLQMQPMRGIWIFYGITAILAIAYTYGIKPFLKK